MKKLKEVSDEGSSGGYESDYKIESRKRVIKLKDKKAKLTEISGAKPPKKSKFLELEADEGSFSEEDDEENEIPRAAKGKLTSINIFCRLHSSI